jgi:hypothetical protein
VSSPSGGDSASFVHVVDQLDAARDNLLMASQMIVGFQFPAFVRLSDTDLVDEITRLALLTSLIADLLDSVIAIQDPVEHPGAIRPVSRRARKTPGTALPQS